MLDDTPDDLEGATAAPVRIGSEHYPIIDRIIEEVRPAIQADGGDIELTAINGDSIRVRLAGACLQCSLAGQTLGGIRRRLVEALRMPVRVLPPLDP